MLFTIIVLLSALSISVIAAYYSIIGLTTIFSGAVIAVAIMGSALEIGKVITATWLHNNWSIIPWLMKTYLTLAVLVLMFITSMGIFGYLSKSHITQGAPMSVVQSKIDQIDFAVKQEQENIVQEQKNIISSQRILDQLDKSLELYFEKGIVRRALREREKQQEERKQVQQQIINANENIKNINIKIAELTSNKFELTQKVKNFEVEVGPIKYIAELVYGKTNTAILDKAVRWIILTLIFVFDPLAILLILAANISFKQYKDNKKTMVIKPEQILNKKIEEPKHFNEHEFEDTMKKHEANMSENNNENKPNMVFDNWEDEVEQDSVYVDIPPNTSNTIKVKMKNKTTPEDTEGDENFVKYGGSFVPSERDILSNSLVPQNRETKLDIPENIFVNWAGITKYFGLEPTPENIEKVKKHKLSPSERETKLAIPEKIAEQHKIAHQEALNMPANIVYKSVMPSKSQLNTTIQDAFDKASVSPQMPYNLNSESGEYLKKILLNELEQKFQELNKEPTTS